MECNRFVNEKIGEADSPDFRDHLAGCAGCARDVEELREVRTLYRKASTEKYRGGIPRARRFRLGWVPMAAAAAVLILVFGMVLRDPAEVEPTKTEKPPPETSSGYFQVYLEPWGAEARIGMAIDECWKKLERLENER
jgi:hypothetical protein